MGLLWRSTRNKTEGGSVDRCELASDLCGCHLQTAGNVLLCLALRSSGVLSVYRTARQSKAGDSDDQSAVEEESACAIINRADSSFFGFTISVRGTRM
jgi:hypothetical protein